MYKKYFVWSFDDGLEQDKRIIQTLRQYKMGATFNLNSGMYGTNNMIGRIGNFGFWEKPYDHFKAGKKHFLKYAPHIRIPKAEVTEVYRGFEIASHAYKHELLTRLSGKEMELSISLDIRNLSNLFGREILGFAYPYGANSSKTENILKKYKIQYARVSGIQKSFDFPVDPMHLQINCWHISRKTFHTLDRFIQAQPLDRDLLFLMFAHGYEFDFNTPESSWNKFEKICETVAKHDEIICCSTIDALSRRF